MVENIQLQESIVATLKNFKKLILTENFGRWKIKNTFNKQK